MPIAGSSHERRPYSYSRSGRLITPNVFLSSPAKQTLVLQVAVLDLVSGVETVLPEERSVDDQVAWLDDDTLLHGLPREGAAGDADVWSIPADGSGEPELYLEHAWSPSIVRG